MQDTYDFCPKCGAVVRNGICTSCGAVYGKTENINKTGGWGENTGSFQEQEAWENQEAVENQEMDGRWAEGAAEDAKSQYAQPVPGADNYYGGQYPAGSGNTENKKNTAIWIGALAATFLVVIVLVVYIAFEVGKLSKGNFLANIKGSVEDAFRESEEKKENEKEYSIDDEADEDFWEQYEQEQAFQYDENFKEERKNYDASQITGPYYEEFVNCIDESVSYKVKREFFEKIEEEYGLCIQVSYIQLEGDIPNLEAINEKLKEESMLLADAYMEEEEALKGILGEYEAMTFCVRVESIVTVNDEESISIVLDETCEFGGYSNVRKIYGININLKTGTILNNTEILNIDEEFVKDFVKRSNKQNGEASIAIEGISDREKLQLFQDDESLIVFYTPIGLEVGYNYSGVENYVGWITISLQDYEQYLKGY